MKKFYHSNALLICLVAMVCLQPLGSHAQWSTSSFNNTIICIEAGVQEKSVMTSDGAGGAIIAWYDTRNGNADIYAQRVDANGIILWTANGIPICNDPTFQAQVVIISDGSGGAIIAWVDFRDIVDPNIVDSNIYAQRVNGNGDVLWATNGIGVSKAQNEQTYPALASDGNGGAYVTWRDNRGSSQSNMNIYAQGINSNGILKGSEIIVCTSVENQINPVITSDGNNGAILVWQDSRNQSNGTNGDDLYAQRINANGSTQWIADGVPICEAARMQYSLTLETDGSGGALIAWLDERNVSVSSSNIDIYAQRINAGGTVLWTQGGIGIATTSTIERSPSITSDKVGGAVIAWQGLYNGSNNIVLQRVNSSGSKLWMTNGVQIGSGGKELPIVACDNSGTFLVWKDNRNLGGDNIYAQRLDENGTEQWTFGGVVVSNANGSQLGHQLLLDNNGGAIIAWTDSRNIPTDIYAQHIKMDGTLGGATVVGSQTITFNSIPQKKISDGPFDPGAIASSNLSITYSSSNLAVATISGSSVTITGVGTSTITANQAGDASFGAALPVSQQLTVIKADQTISFNALPSKAVGDSPFTISATTSSDLVVSFESSNTAVATVSGNTVTVVGLGSTNITASQAGNANYNAAQNVVQPFSVKAGQSISFSSIQGKTLGDPAFILTATASSGLQPTFSSSSDKISISGNQVTLLKAGSVTIKADQSGNANFAPAPQQTQTFCIAPAKPSITVTGLGTETPLLTSNSPSGNQWFKDGIAVGGATSQTFTVSSEGVYTLVTSIDNCTSVVSDEKTFIITGIENLDDGVKVFPNPMNYQLHVDVTELSKSAPVSVIMYDIVGNVLHSSLVNEITAIDVGSYQPGIYLLKIQTGKQTIVKKLKK